MVYLNSIKYRIDVKLNSVDCSRLLRNLTEKTRELELVAMETFT